jgi:DNA polymerase
MSRYEKTSKILEHPPQVCVDCGALKTAKTMIMSDGDTNTGVVVITEAPEFLDDPIGELLEPGSTTGILFDEMLASAGLRRKQVFLTSVVKCKPAEAITDKQIAYCSGFLEEQFRKEHPQVIITLGAWAMKWVLRRVTGCPESAAYKEKISLLHGKILHGFTLCGPVLICPLYHPAAIIRDMDKKAGYRMAWMQVGASLKEMGLPKGIFDVKTEIGWCVEAAQ